MKAGQTQRACDACKPGTTMVHPNSVFGLHLADALSIDPDANRKVPEDCAFIGRISALPGSADTSFEWSSGEATDQAAVDESRVQEFWNTGVNWVLQEMSKLAAK